MEPETSIFIPGPGSTVGSAVGGPIGAIAGGLFDALTGFGRGGGGAGLGDAFTAGLGSLFGSSSSAEANQTQVVDQSTVVNVLNGRTFGNYDAETGSFDEFQALSDVFAIKAALDTRAVGATPAPAAPAKKAVNYTPLILAGVAAAVFMISRR